MDTRKALDGPAIALMVVLCATWGMQQVALKATASDISPLLQVSVRSGLAAGLVALVMLFRKEKLLPANGTWRAGLVVGALFALEYLLVGEGLRYTSAAHSAVFLYTAPVFAALGLHWKLRSERLQPLQWAGIAIAFIGIAIAFLGGGLLTASAPISSMANGDLLALGAGASWGATTVVIRTTRLSQAPATQTLLYQLLGAFLLLLAAATIRGQLAIHPTPLVLAGLVFQTVVVSFASFLAWFWLLRHYLASRLGVFSFLTPIFGVVLGAWLLNEPVEPGFLAGGLMVLTGILFVSGQEWWLLQRRTSAGAPETGIKAL
jgi:drug/metabolite transporter (DMT)-like permease